MSTPASSLAPWEEAKQGSGWKTVNTPSAKMPWEEAASAARPQGDLGQNTESLSDKLTRITPDSPRMGIGDRAANFVGNIGAGAMGLIRHPYDAFTGMVKSVIPGTDTPNPIQSLYESANTAPADTAASLIGQTAVLGGAGEFGPPALDLVGRGLKAAGGKIADVAAVGSNALDRQFGAQPGRALSEQRIVGTTKAGLLKKVNATVPDLAQERGNVLSQSQAGPTNVRADVDQPFADLTSKVTGKTGVASPAEIASLTRARAAAGFEQDPFTGKPLQDPITGGPVPRDLEHMSPAEIAEFNSNLRGMGNYEAQTSPLADQAIKTAGHNLRTRLAAVAPESVDLTRQTYNAETASDVLRRGLPSEGAPNMSPYAIYNPRYGIIANTAGKIARGVGTTAAAGLDLAGSGFRTLASKLSPPGPPPAGSARPQQPQPPAGLLPGNAGPAGPQQPPVVPPPPQPEMGPGPAPAGALPQVAGMTRRVPPASPPPNVSLTERVSPRPAPQGPVVGPTTGLVGPEGRVTTRTPTGFGPKVAAPEFTIPPKRLTQGGGNAIQEPGSTGVLPRKQRPAGEAGGGRGGVGRGKQGEAPAGKGQPAGGGPQPNEGGTLTSKVKGKKEKK